jgi:hypothetical protein
MRGSAIHSDALTSVLQLGAALVTFQNRPISRVAWELVFRRRCAAVGLPLLARGVGRSRRITVLQARLRPSGILLRLHALASPLDIVTAAA